VTLASFSLVFSSFMQTSNYETPVTSTAAFNLSGRKNRRNHGQLSKDQVVNDQSRSFQIC
jgi:hypothetical protein